MLILTHDFDVYGMRSGLGMDKLHIFLTLLRLELSAPAFLRMRNTEEVSRALKKRGWMG